MPAGDGWELQVQLQKRDHAKDWESWQYEDDGRTIAREWAPVYCLPLSEAKARYYPPYRLTKEEIAVVEGWHPASDE